MPQRTTPMGIALLALDSARKSALPIIGGLVGSQSITDGALSLTLPLIAAIVIGLGSIGGALRWWRTTYRVGERDIQVTSGLINRSARSVPYERIQDTSVEQTFLARLLGLVEVQFETGAGGKDELKLAYVTAGEGERLRELVRERRLDQGATDANDEAGSAPDSQPMFAMDLRRVLTFGLFEFSLVIFALLAGAAQQLDFLLPSRATIETMWHERAADLLGIGIGAQIAGAAAAIGVLALLGVITGLGRTLLRDYAFRLDLTARGFRRRRGLLTRSDTVMPVHRVQAIEVGTKIVRRLFGWHSLQFVSLAADGAKASHHQVAPFGTLAEIWPIVRAAGFHAPVDGLRWQHASLRAAFDGLIPLAIVAVLACIGLIVSGHAAYAVLPPIGPAILGAVRWLHYRHLTFAIDAGQMYRQEGWLAPDLLIGNRAKVHSAAIVQRPIARWRGYANLVLGIAGGSFTCAAMPLHAARAMRGAIMDSVVAADLGTPELPPQG